MTSLPPWANGPFELLVHAEGHLLGGEDFDRRIALISFDTAYREVGARLCSGGKASEGKEDE